MQYPDKKQIADALEVLAKAKADTSALLESVPDLQLRSDNVFERLINGIKHALGISLDEGEATVRGGRLTKILGRSIKKKSSEKISNATKPSQEEVTDMDLLTHQAYEDFLVLEPKELLEKHGEMPIRGVGVMMGMEVTPTLPEKVDVAFIKKIKAEIIKHNEQVMQTDEADAAAKNAKAPETLTKEMAGANLVAANEKVAAAEIALTDANNKFETTTAALKSLPADAKPKDRNKAEKAVNDANKLIGEATAKHDAAISEAEAADTALEQFNNA